MLKNVQTCITLPRGASRNWTDGSASCHACYQGVVQPIGLFWKSVGAMQGLC